MYVSKFQFHPGQENPFLIRGSFVNRHHIVYTMCSKMSLFFLIAALIVGRVLGNKGPATTSASHWIQHSYWLDSTCSTEYAGEIGFGAETCYPSEQTSFALGPYVLVYYSYYSEDVETIFYYYSDSGCYESAGNTQSSYESTGCTYDSAYNLYYKELVLTAVPTVFPADGTLVT